MGVNTDDDEQEYRQKLDEFEVTWTNAWEGGDICKKYGVRSFPKLVILDHEGIVRAADTRGERMAVEVEKLLAEMKKKGVGAGQ